MNGSKSKGFAVAANTAAIIIVAGMVLRFVVAIHAGDHPALQIAVLLGVLVLGLVVWLVIWSVWYSRRHRMRQRVKAAYPGASLEFDLFPSLSTIPTATDQTANDLMARSHMSQLCAAVVRDQLVFIRLGSTTTSVDEYSLESIGKCGLTRVTSGARNLHAIELELPTGSALRSQTAVLVPRAIDGAGIVPAKATDVKRLEGELRNLLGVVRP